MCDRKFEYREFRALCQGARIVRQNPANIRTYGISKHHTYHTFDFQCGRTLRPEQKLARSRVLKSDVISFVCQNYTIGWYGPPWHSAGWYENVPKKICSETYVDRRVYSNLSFDITQLVSRLRWTPSLLSLYVHIFKGPPCWYYDPGWGKRLFAILTCLMGLRHCFQPFLCAY